MNIKTKKNLNKKSRLFIYVNRPGSFIFLCTSHIDLYEKHMSKALPVAYFPLK